MERHADVSWADRLGHYGSELLITAIAATVVIGLYPPPGLFALTIPVALFGVVILAWLLMRHHDRRLCETCVLSMPLNPSAQAQRYRRRFWMAHTGTEPRFFVPYLVVLIGSNFAHSTPGRVLWAVVQLSTVWLILSQTTHRRLQPWCPWCRGDGGGEDVDETPPVLPHDDRQLI